MFLNNSSMVQTKADIAQANTNNINSLNKKDISHLQIKNQKNNLINQELNQRNSNNINANNVIYNNIKNRQNNNNRNINYLNKSMNQNNMNDSNNSVFMNDDELIKDFEKNYILINGQYINKNQMKFLDNNRTNN
jgi:hypothetical protein